MKQDFCVNELAIGTFNPFQERGERVDYETACSCGHPLFAHSTKNGECLHVAHERSVSREVIAINKPKGKKFQKPRTYKLPNLDLHVEKEVFVERLANS